MNLIRRLFAAFEIGGRRPLLVRRERVPRIGVGKRVLFASDLHLRMNGPRRIMDDLIRIAADEAPDLVLLGGDLVDWRTGIDSVQLLVSELTRFAPVGAVAGNHDRWIGVARVRNAVLAGGGVWLEDTPFVLTPDCAVYGSTSSCTVSAKYRVLCTHHPEAAGSEAHFDLTLSGHLHGGQLVLYERRGRLYPGAFLYRWNGLRFEDSDGRTLLISRGVQDTVPLRWNCPREVLLVEL